MFKFISMKSIGTTALTLTVLLGGLLASPVSSAFAKASRDFVPTTTAEYRAETRKERLSSYQGKYFFPQYLSVSSVKEPHGLAAIRRSDK